MGISKEELKNVADLAKLRIDEGEIEKLVSDIDEIIRYMDTLNELDTAGAESEEYRNVRVNVFREDEPGCPFDRDRIIAPAPNKKDGYIIIPGITFG